MTIISFLINKIILNSNSKKSTEDVRIIYKYCSTSLNLKKESYNRNYDDGKLFFYIGNPIIENIICFTSPIRISLSQMDIVMKKFEKILKYPHKLPDMLMKNKIK